MFCVYCGTKLQDGARFCSNCGKQLAVPGQEEQEPAKTYDAEDVTSTLLYIKETYGKNVLASRDKLLAYFGDLAPTLKDEKVMLDRMARRGIIGEFIAAENADEAAKNRVIAMQLTVLVDSEYIREDIAAKYLGVLSDVFAWGIPVAAGTPQPAPAVQSAAAPVMQAAPAPQPAAPGKPPVTQQAPKPAQKPTAPGKPRQEQPKSSAPGGNAVAGGGSNLIFRTRTIAANSHHVYAITKSGDVVSSKNKIEMNNVVSLAVGCDVVGVRPDGTVGMTGTNYEVKYKVEAWSDIAVIACSDKTVVGVRRDGTVAAIERKIRKEVYSWNHIVDLKISKMNTDMNIVALKADGTVLTTDADCKEDVEKWRDIVEVDMAHSHIVGLKADGTVVTSGFLLSDEREVVESWHDIVAIACGYAHTVGLKADGTVVAHGSNRQGACEVENWRGIVAIACGPFNTIGLRADGTMVATRCDLMNEEEYKTITSWRDIRV